MEKLAIFDVDYTITSRETLRQLYYFSIKKYPKNIIYGPRAVLSGIMFLLGVFDEKRTKEMFLKFVHGIEKEKMEKLVKEFYEEKLSKILYKDAVDMMKKLKGQGYRIYLISASPEFYLKELYAIEEVDRILGTRFKITENTHTRFMEGNNCKGQEKVTRLMEAIEEEGIEVDFKESYMFSDSLSDLPLLNLVGKPYLINYKKHYGNIEVLKWR